MSNRRKKVNNSGNSSPEWLTTYSDLVTLLLTFFVLLFSFSTIDAQKWKSLVSSLQGGSGVLDGGTDMSESKGDLNQDRFVIDEKEMEHKNDNKDSSDKFVNLYYDIEEYIDSNDIQAEVHLSKAHTEILIRFKEYILFDSGRADIKPEAYKILDGIAAIIKKFDKQIQHIRVEGHTDNKPINTYVYPTNWELSGGRAARVVRYFQEKHNIAGSRLSFAGYGEYCPIDTNKTEKGRSKNRRVDITIVRAVNDPQGTRSKKE